MEVKTARKTYRVATRPFVEGDVGLLYRGTCIEGEGPDSRVVLKLAREAEDNDLVRNEARVLGRLKGTPSAQSKHLPVLLDQFRSGDRNGVVLRQIDAFDGTTLREKLPSGVPAEHAAWILARLLSVLGYAHSKGVVHGNVEPAHVMVRPRDHNVFVIDWTAAAVEPARTGEGFRTLNEVYSPPEVAERKPPVPASDLYSAGKTMVFLLGGNPQSGELPPSVPGRLGRILSFMTLPSPRQRAQDAWEMHREVGLAREELYGPHSFVEFRV
jgi:serine/threonine protein kinase